MAANWGGLTRRRRSGTTNESAYSLNQTKACRPVSVRTIGAFGWRGLFGSSAMNPPRHRFQYAVLPAGPIIVQNSPVRVRVISPRETASSPLSWDLVNSGTACLAFGASSLRLPQPLHGEFVVVALQVPPTFHWSFVSILGKTFKIIARHRSGGLHFPRVFLTDIRIFHGQLSVSFIEPNKHLLRVDRPFRQMWVQRAGGDVRTLG